MIDYDSDSSQQSHPEVDTPKAQKNTQLVKIESIIEKFSSLLQEATLDSLARESGFVKRKPQKIDPQGILLAFFLMILENGKFLRSIATTLGNLKGICISKQAIDKRLHEPFIKFLEYTLALSLAQKLRSSCLSLSGVFKRIIIADSTTIQLPSSLAKSFPGSKNGKAKNVALAKIQAVYDLLTERFCWFWLTPFTTTDQTAASMMLSLIKPGDLLIRDLGYFVLSSLAFINKSGAFFISRLRYGTALYDPHTGQRIDLLELLKKHQQLDISVIAGCEERLPIRLIAVPADVSVAAERRRKLKANRDSRLNPSKEHLELLGWHIFILNVPDTMLSPKQVVKLYALRWRIETIFKAWKSNFHLTTVPPASIEHVQASIYTFLIFITLLHCVIDSDDMMKNHQKPISLLKLTRTLKEQSWAILLYIARPAIFYQQVRYHCAFDVRHDRKNYYQTKF